ncbi:MAG: hypothetical protein FWD19_01015 [Defluviitaleaceae bacterium]|nr:hypothetical protein [Defluviitaleaceae bacterium]
MKRNFSGAVSAEGMSKKMKRIFFFVVAIIFFASNVFADARNIFIGDIVTIKISSRDFSSHELTEKFGDFEIVEMKNENDGWLVSLRTFEAGEYKILLGNKYLTLKVASVLEEIDRDEIFDGDSHILESVLLFDWFLLFCFSFCVFIFSGAFLFFKTKKQNAKKQNPLERFFARARSLSDENFFVDLTFFFKEFIEDLFAFRIIGKTSTEIIFELKQIKSLDFMLAEISEWLFECDRIKFTGVEISAEEKHAHYEKLILIAEKIFARAESAKKIASQKKD